MNRIPYVDGTDVTDARVASVECYVIRYQALVPFLMIAPCFTCSWQVLKSKNYVSLIIVYNIIILDHSIGLLDIHGFSVHERMTYGDTRSYLTTSTWARGIQHIYVLGNEGDVTRFNRINVICLNVHEYCITKSGEHQK